MKIEWAKVKESTEAIKNICTLFLYVVITLFFLIVVWPKLKDFEIKKVNFGGTELGPKEKQAIKTLETVSNNVSNQGKDTASISPKLIEAAKIVDTSINLNSQSWVYLGQKVGGELTNTHFKIMDIPQVGDMLTARDAVYKRKDLPVELKNSNWKLGDIKGVVAGNESVKINAIKEIQDGNYWALIQ